eukprot:2972118-Lingulodinium_polyedra.AAC.1
MLWISQFRNSRSLRLLAAINSVTSLYNLHVSSEPKFLLGGAGAAARASAMRGTLADRRAPRRAERRRGTGPAL